MSTQTHAANQEHQGIVYYISKSSRSVYHPAVVIKFSCASWLDIDRLPSVANLGPPAQAVYRRAMLRSVVMLAQSVNYHVP